MTLVLAFGVQGIVDAVTTSLTTAAESTSLVDITARQVGSDIGSTAGATAGIAITSITLEDTAPLADTGPADDTTGADNSNAIEMITVSASNIQLTAPTFTTSVTFSESTTTATQTTTSQPMLSFVTLTGYFLREGVATLTITYRDLANTEANNENQSNDNNSATSKTLTHTYTYYVVKSDEAIPETTVLSLTSAPGTSVNSEGYVTGLNGRTDFSIFGNNTGNYPVMYSVDTALGNTPTPTLYINKDPYTASDPAAVGTIISSSGARKVWLDMNGSGPSSTFDEGHTSVVTVNIGRTSGSLRSSFNVAYIFGTPKLAIDIDGTNGVDASNVTDEPLRDRYRFTSGTAGANAGTITATVHDGTATVDTTNGSISRGTIEGVLVKFELQQKGSTTGYLEIDDPGADAGQGGTRVDARNNTKPFEDLQSDIAQTLYVRTNASGQAKVTYEFGTLGSQEIIVSSVGLRKMVSAEIGSGQTDKRITVKTNRQQSGNSRKYDLVAEVKDGDGEPVSTTVTFRTDRGTLTPITTSGPSGEMVSVTTNDLGEAHAVYDIGDNTGRQEIIASFTDGTDQESVTFVINGSARSSLLPVTTNTITITPSDIEGEPGDEVDVRITSSPLGRFVEIDSGDLDDDNFSSLRGTTPLDISILLPDEEDEYTFTVSGPTGFTSASATVTVESEALGSLTIESVGTPVNGSQTIRVTVRDSDGDLAVVAVEVTLTGPGISRTVETVNGTGAAVITLPATTATLTVRADGYSADSITLTATGQTTTGTQTTTRGTPGEADSIEIDGSRQLSGTVNQALRLRVRVLDANDNGVADVRVTFRILAPGRGRLSQRGNGRASQDQTDSRGYADATLTPLDDGDIIVRAQAAGVSAPVTFIIDVGEADDDDTEPSPPSRDEPTSREISPVVHVGAASRPPMLWVDGGAIYALVGANAQRFAPSVDNALNIAIGGSKVYWTEMTGESGGTINSANLDGTGVTELASIFATPIGIAIDTAGSKLYWTNSAGRIQSANLDGSRITNVLQNLPGPMDIAVARGIVYWTQFDATASAGNVGIVNPTAAQTVARYVSTGSDTPGSIVVNGGKVYWTEMTGGSGGTVNSANLNGTGAAQLASILAAPIGIAVDGSRSKLYWTNSRGRVQSANLNGSGIKNVVSGLGSPGDMVLSNSITAPAAAPAETASDSKYDVNGDGTVDLKDRNAVAVASLTDSPDAKYDVNGDGAVDAFDLIEIIENLTPGAAGAPTLFGMQLTVAQIDRLQEQIDLLVAANDRSPAAMRTLIYLQQLLVTARPEKTQLLANYPNPFNPETWIPYELATDTNVKVTIYNTQGVVIRTLQLGHQSGGYYTGRDRAAYWDGRNALGEQVASGLYFYQLETDEMSLMRKMVILK